MADAPLGHNRPPADADPLRDRLGEEYATMKDRHDALLASVKAVPEVVTDANAGRVADFVKQVGAHTKALDIARVAEKEPFLNGGRTVDGYFKTMTGALESRHRPALQAHDL